MEGPLSFLKVHALKCQFRPKNMKHHTLRTLNKKHLLLTFLEAGKSKIKVLANVVPGGSPLFGLQMDALLLCPHMAGRETSPFSCLFLGGTNPIRRVPLPNTVTLGIRGTTHELGRTQTFSPKQIPSQKHVEISGYCGLPRLTSN